MEVYPVFGPPLRSFPLTAWGECEGGHTNIVYVQQNNSSCRNLPTHIASFRGPTLLFMEQKVVNGLGTRLTTHTLLNTKTTLGIYIQA